MEEHVGGGIMKLSARYLVVPGWAPAGRFLVWQTEADVIQGFRVDAREVVVWRPTLSTSLPDPSRYLQSMAEAFRLAIAWELAGVLIPHYPGTYPSVGEWTGGDDPDGAALDRITVTAAVLGVASADPPHLAEPWEGVGAP